jgi:hypothetical protein
MQHRIDCVKAAINDTVAGRYKGCFYIIIIRVKEAYNGNGGGRNYA